MTTTADEMKCRTLCEVVLEKVRDGHGKQPVGALYSWTYKSTPHNEALKRASKALLRDHPGEDPLDWRRI